MGVRMKHIVGWSIVGLLLFLSLIIIPLVSGFDPWWKPLVLVSGVLTFAGIVTLIVSLISAE